jgi:hypothetical protein
VRGGHKGERGNEDGGEDNVLAINVVVESLQNVLLHCLGDNGNSQPAEERAHTDSTDYGDNEL